jgi:hypothetical protein
VALATNSFSVTAATNANPVALTFSGPAPATGAPVALIYTAPKGAASSPWSKLNGAFVATKVGPSSCSIPIDSSTFGPLSAAPGTLTIALPYTLNYLCALHPDETGTITVNPQR